MRTPGIATGSRGERSVRSKVQPRGSGRRHTNGSRRWHEQAARHRDRRVRSRRQVPIEVRDPAPPQFVMPYRQVDTGCTHLLREGRRRHTGGASERSPPSSAGSTLTSRSAIFGRWRIRFRTDTSGTCVDHDVGGVRRLAIVLAAIGLYAVLAYGVAQRLREIGIRIALGATPRDIRGLVLGQVSRIGIVGGLIGAALALGLGGSVRRCCSVSKPRLRRSSAARSCSRWWSPLPRRSCPPGEPH